MNQEIKNAQDENGKYPGYPHYPSNEDVTNPDNNNGIIGVNEENISLPEGGDSALQKNAPASPEDEDVKIIMGTEADVTAEDLQLLGDRDEDMDLGEDEDINRLGLENTDEDGDLLNERSGDNASTGADLDVPGSEADDANEDIGEEDEENNYYSLSDNNDDAG